MERIENHPILGETPKRKKVTFSYDGKLLGDMRVNRFFAPLRRDPLWLRYTAKKHEPEELCNRQVHGLCNDS